MPIVNLPTGRKNREISLVIFADQLQTVSRSIGFRLSARGWCYQLEGFGSITKAEFDKVERYINECRAKGYLPIDFTAEEEGRRFSGVEVPEERTPAEFMKNILEAAMKCEDFYAPDWWAGEDYYIQMVVEKIDLKTLFSPVCEDYHIPIATSKGWSSMLQRAEYAKRFKMAEEKGMECVLLYCGDHDPDGLRISEFIKNNLMDLSHLVWSDGTRGYDPSSLEILRFGLNYDFIVDNDLTWIDNLITGSKRDLASPSHPNHYLSYVQDYIGNYGERKCEANALVVRPDAAGDLVREAIVGFLGEDALDRFEERREEIRQSITKIRKDTGVASAIKEAINILKDED